MSKLWAFLKIAGAQITMGTKITVWWSRTDYLFMQTNTFLFCNKYFISENILKPELRAQLFKANDIVS